METIKSLFVFGIVGIPITGGLFFCLKLLLIEGVKYRENGWPENDRLIYFLKLMFLILSILITFSILIFFLVILFFPEIKEMVHPIWIAIGVVALFTYYYTFYGFAYGLGQVIGISGVPARKIFKELLRESPCMENIRNRKENA